MKHSLREETVEDVASKEIPPHEEDGPKLRFFGFQALALLETARFNQLLIRGECYASILQASSPAVGLAQLVVCCVASWIELFGGLEAFYGARNISGLQWSVAESK